MMFSVVVDLRLPCSPRFVLSGPSGDVAGSCAPFIKSVGGNYVFVVSCLSGWVGLGGERSCMQVPVGWGGRRP